MNDEPSDPRTSLDALWLFYGELYAAFLRHGIELYPDNPLEPGNLWRIHWAFVRNHYEFIGIKIRGGASSAASSFFDVYMADAEVTEHTCSVRIFEAEPDLLDIPEIEWDTAMKIFLEIERAAYKYMLMARGYECRNTLWRSIHEAVALFSVHFPSSARAHAWSASTPPLTSE